MLRYVLLFIIVFSYFLWLNPGANFSDPDSFYHAKTVELIQEQGIIKEFRWLPFTTLNNIYIDHHLLYHWLLTPFFYLGNSLAVLKIMTTVLAALAIVVFYWWLNQRRVQYSWFYVLSLLSAHQFVFRLNLAKTPAISLIFLLIFSHYLFKHQNKWSWPLFIISWLYVWLYGGWPIMLGIGIIYYLADVCLEGVGDGKKQKLTEVGGNLKKLFFNNKIYILSIAGGIIAGLVINPYFPKNLKFYWQQTVQIGVKNYQNIIGVGGEWYGFNLMDLIGYEPLVFTVILLALSIFIRQIKRPDRPAWTLFLVSLVFFILTVKSRRNVEYFIPFSLLFSGLALDGYLEQTRMESLKLKIKQFFDQHLALAIMFVFIFVAQLMIIAGFNYFSLKGALAGGYKWNQFQGVSQWLAGQSQPGEIVFHDNWSDWPLLFYYNSKNRYIIGLDPTFMYFKDKDKYQRWHDISAGKIKDGVCDKIRTEFSAGYVLVRTDNHALRENIENDQGCELGYKDGDGYAYKIHKSF